MTLGKSHPLWVAPAGCDSLWLPSGRCSRHSVPLARSSPRRRCVGDTRQESPTVGRSCRVRLVASSIWTIFPAFCPACQVITSLKMRRWHSARVTHCGSLLPGATRCGFHLDDIPGILSRLPGRHLAEDASVALGKSHPPPFIATASPSRTPPATLSNFREKTTISPDLPASRLPVRRPMPSKFAGLSDAIRTAS